MDRRNFLKRVVKLFFLSLNLSLIIIISYLYPSKIKQKRLLNIYVTDEEFLPKKGIKRFEYSFDKDGERVTNFVFIKRDEEGLTAFSPFCTHLGCLIRWNNIHKEFICACHGGRFDKEGNVIAGPPPRPLERMPIEIKDGKVFLGIKA
ncbi:MAG: Rieske 2Fe-2S domain-containing protein [Thermodesulfovibrionales bacterium]|nr:Rieske 2Fe-2S domain-containing protein [Thermodesulfovibrionales bacterium]